MGLSISVFDKWGPTELFGILSEETPSEQLMPKYKGVTERW